MSLSVSRENKTPVEIESVFSLVFQTYRGTTVCYRNRLGFKRCGKKSCHKHILKVSYAAELPVCRKTALLKSTNALEYHGLPYTVLFNRPDLVVQEIKWPFS